MLNIPSTVQALFRRDGVRKNFRVHFPGGELPDITNDNIVRESVSFNESVCSQDVLKFGLTEASTVEFETVGILTNMYGMTIECGIEVDISSLSAAQISAIESGTWDGTLVKQADSDLGYGFFRVPYGVFRIESCPRNQEAMTHRKVTAYTKTITESQGIPFPEQQKLGAKGGSSTMSVNVRRQALYLMAYDDLVTLEENDFTKTFVADDSSFTTFTRSASFYGIDINATVKRCSLASSISDFSSQAQDAIFTLVPGRFTTVYQQCLDWLENEGAVIDFRVETALRAVYAIPTLSYSQTWYGETYISITDEELVYPPRTGVNAAFCVPSSISISYNGHSTTITPTGADPAEVYVWTDDDPVTQTLLFASTNNGISNGRTWYTFTGSYEIDKLVNGYLELMGTFAKASRSGGFNIVELDDSSPISIGPGDSAECWWDEYDVNPVGAIMYNYGENNTATYEFGMGASVYDMTDNYVLTHLQNADQDAIEALLESTLVPKLTSVRFTPVTLSIRALPWLEAGDAIQVTAEDGTIVDSYALVHGISGIQALFAAIESKGGEIVGEV